MSVAIPLHLLAAVIWVGGMFFAYVCLRPVVASQLEPPARLKLFAGVFGRFFPWIWVCIGVLLATGFWLIFGPLGGMKSVGVHVHIMLAIGIVMMLVFIHVFFAPFRRLRLAVASEDWPAGGKALDTIRKLVATNTVLGVVTIFVGAGGRYLLG
mgnify:CR=1 FL=1|jgi:uncharacterized membrane protein